MTRKHRASVDGSTYPHPVDLTVDAFHALARSSPWRWRSLHFLATGEAWEVEAWVVRPGWQLVRDHAREHVTDEGSRAVVDEAPTYRADGLVAKRPWAPVHNAFDDPMWPGAGYDWVAMLDPQELSHDVTVAELRQDELAGRETWRATVRAAEGYEARCPDCCDLLLGGFAQRLPYDVSLDVGTGVLVQLRALAGDRDRWLRNEIIAVDHDVVVPD